MYVSIVHPAPFTFFLALVIPFVTPEMKCHMHKILHTSTAPVKPKKPKNCVRLIPYNVAKKHILCHELEVYEIQESEETSVIEDHCMLVRSDVSVGVVIKE